MAGTVAGPIHSLPARWWALHVGGDLDISTTGEFTALIGRALIRLHGDGLVLDLSAVAFMDCAGLRPLLRTRDRLAHRLCLRGLQPLVLRLLELAEVADGLRILPPEVPWPAEADPLACGVLLVDPVAHDVLPVHGSLPRDRTPPSPGWLGGGPPTIRVWPRHEASARPDRAVIDVVDAKDSQPR